MRPFQSPSIRKPKRERCELKRNSEFFAFTVLLYGMLPQLLPTLVPAFLSRQRVSRSRDATGIRQVLPILMNVGEGAPSSHGLSEP